MFDPDRLLPAAFELGERLSLGGKRPEHLTAIEPNESNCAIRSARRADQ
jgi:hypothetical protein